MIYDAKNSARGSTVIDVDTKQTITRVISIDTDKAELTCFPDPIEVTSSGDIATFKMRFHSIYAICGSCVLPQLFHCYGRITNG